jgi:hypothetical protein
MDTYVYLLTNAGAVLASDDDAGVGLCSFLSHTVTAGEAAAGSLTMCVQAWSGGATGNYQLHTSGASGLDCDFDDPMDPLDSYSVLCSSAIPGLCPVGSVDHCDIGVQFSPDSTSPAVKNNTLLVTATPGGSVQTSMFGTAQAQLQITGPFTVGTTTSNAYSLTTDVSNGDSDTRDFRITNTSTSVTSGTLWTFLDKATEFMITANDCGPARSPSQFCTVTVRYRPTTAGTDTANVSVTANPGDTDTQGITATSVP